HNAQQSAKILVAAGGSTETPYNNVPDVASNGTSYGQAVASFVNSNNLDGADFDLENILAGFTDAVVGSKANLVTWIDSATTGFAGPSGSSGKILTHAPQAPYFGSLSGFASGYNQVNIDVGADINWYNIQYYNQGISTYNTYQDLFVASSNQPGTAVHELNTEAQPIPLSKIVVGKLILTSDGGSGWVSPYSL